MHHYTHRKLRLHTPQFVFLSSYCMQRVYWLRRYVDSAEGHNCKVVRDWEGCILSFDSHNILATATGTDSWGCLVGWRGVHLQVKSLSGRKACKEGHTVDVVVDEMFNSAISVRFRRRGTGQEAESCAIMDSLMDGQAQQSFSILIITADRGYGLHESFSDCWRRYSGLRLNGPLLKSNTNTWRSSLLSLALLRTCKDYCRNWDATMEDQKLAAIRRTNSGGKAECGQN